jgi:uncharacterized protein with FMN-binding domain
MRRSLPIAFTALTTVLPTAALVTRAAEAATRPSAPSYTGRSVATRYGPVQVTITVRARHILSVGAAAPTQQKRSARLNEHAVVVLSRETLQAQSANIHSVSGATITSRAFEASLASALHAAHL